MLEQTFALSDIPKIGVLTFIELSLSTDNAIVLGVIIRTLPEVLRRKALLIGVVSAFFLRAFALLIVSFLIEHIWVQLLGAAYLLYLSVKYFVSSKKSEKQLASSTSFWKTVVVIELFDLAFAIDSIVAGVAFIGPASGMLNPKLWIVYVGGMLGLLGIRYAAHFFSNLLDRFPRLEMSAHLMIGWIGLELGAGAFHWRNPLIFWSGLILLFLFGLIRVENKK